MRPKWWYVKRVYGSYGGDMGGVVSLRGFFLTRYHAYRPDGAYGYFSTLFDLLDTIKERS